MTLDPYTWMKALHVAGAITFIGGVMGSAIYLASARPAHDSPADAIRRWDRMVTSPSMLLTWAFGMALAFQGSKFRDGWLIAKVALVIAASGLHGVQSAKLRRLAGGQAIVRPSGVIVPLVVAGIVAVAVLVIVKPF